MFLDLLRQLLTLLDTINTVVGTIVDQAGSGSPFTDESAGVGAVANATPTFFLPAGYAFVIWAVIFLLRGAFAVYQALPAQRHSPLLRRVGWWWLLNLAAASAWSYAFESYAFTAAWLLILVQLVALVMAFVGLRDEARSGREWWLVRLPISMNLGWIAVASISNTAQFLRHVLGWQGGPLGEPAWAALLIAVVVALTAFMVFRARSVVFGMVAVWGVAAIAVNYPDQQIVAGGALAGALAAAAITLLGWLRLRRADARPPVPA